LTTWEPSRTCRRASRIPMPWAPASAPPAARPPARPSAGASAGPPGAPVGGVVGGPPGALIGAAVGGVIGGFARRGIAEAINPVEEEAFWRENHRERPYAAGRKYEELAPAYRYGWESRIQHADRPWHQVEGHLERGWDKARGESSLAWHEAKPATRDAWDRVDDALSRRPERESQGAEGER